MSMENLEQYLRTLSKLISISKSREERAMFESKLTFWTRAYIRIRYWN